MKAERVNKLYKQLSPVEQANLYIEAVTKRLGEAEVQLIAESVQRVTYDCRHKDFTNHIDCYERLAFVYGTQYWKTQALVTRVALHRQYDGIKAINPELEDRLAQTSKVFYGKLASMELALREVCIKAKFDIEAINWLAEITETDSKIFRPIPPNTDTLDLEHYRQLFHAAAMLEYQDSAANKTMNTLLYRDVEAAYRELLNES
jgi:hypothetical protein